VSSEYIEPELVRASPPLRRELIFGVLDLSIDIDGVGRAAAPLIGINQTDLICLNMLYRRGAMSAGQLAATVGLTGGAMTTVIDRLERGGYVRRRGDAADRRRVLVEADPEAARRAFALFDDLLERIAELSGDYSDEEIAKLVGLLSRYQQVLADFATALRSRSSA
jgi:DNA-binding MarR family transcriptional regulator